MVNLLPKARRVRANIHDQSVRLDKRQFVHSGRTEHVETAVAEEISANDLLVAMESESSEKLVLKKKEKQQLKHEAFVQRLESSHAPYSKSHARRLRRKARDQIASGFEDVALALPNVGEDTVDDSREKKNPDVMQTGFSEAMKPLPRKRKTGMIGEGKGAPLSEKQRRQVLKTEKIRQPLLLATPEFASNPFKALRIHAQNTLIQHEKR
ncbi:hypothetical protein ACEPAH_553 [Sanghuangporus vaninii]